ncbi:MAG TPA: amidase [Anaerolineales bacterium]|nr:amidase [Anaerolineales bacterium]
MNKLNFLTASELASLIRHGKISSQEVLEAHLSQIAQQNPSLNAIVTLNEEQARRKAKQADDALAGGEIWGPLHGVPITIKDVFETEGLRTTSSFKPLAAYVPKQDATVVERLRKAGAIIMGKTNTCELAGDEQTNSPLFGRTNNPWNLERTPGGSSGGSAAAVASGMSPLDIGSDIGGSVRNPAHFCGVFSLKPSDYRVPFTGHIPPPPGSKGRGLLRYFLTPGPLARSVEDLRLALTVIAGPDERQWEVPPVPLAPAPDRDLHDLRFAWSDDFGIPVSAEIRAALANLAEELGHAGCRVERRDPAEFDYGQALQTYGLLKEAVFTVRSTPLNIPRFVWRIIAEQIPSSNSTTRGLLRGIGTNLQGYAGALSQRDGFIAKLERFLGDWDAWLCPVAALPAYPHIPARNPIEQLRATVEVDDQKIPYLLATSVYTGLFNLTGNPVVVLPLGRTKEGLPFGVQVVGRRWSDMALLAVAEKLTQVTGSFVPPPGIQSMDPVSLGEPDSLVLER